MRVHLANHNPAKRHSIAFIDLISLRPSEWIAYGRKVDGEAFWHGCRNDEGCEITEDVVVVRMRDFYEALNRATSCENTMNGYGLKNWMEDM